MKNVNKIFIAAGLMISLNFQVFSQTNSFYVYFKQGEKRINIAENKVELKREPFQIFIEYIKPADIIVSTATEGQTYRLASKGNLMPQIPGFSNQIKPQSFFLNKDIINLTDELYTIWYKTDTHGEQNLKNSDGRFICYRNIEKLYDIEEKRIFKLQDFEKDIYLVFIYTEKDQEGEMVEIQRETVKIDWVDLYDENTKAYLRQKKQEDKARIKDAEQSLKHKQKIAEKEEKALKKLEKKKLKKDKKLKKEAEKKALHDKKKANPEDNINEQN